MILDIKALYAPITEALHTTLTTEKVILDAGCLPEAPEIAAEMGLTGPVAAIYDDNTYAAAGDRQPKADWEIILPAEGLHANEHGVALLEARLPEGAGYYMAVGSGTVHDLTRYCAFHHGVPFVSCPTAASVDGFCSSVAAMTMHGAKKTIPTAAPKLVVADLDIVANAPSYLAASGYGDMMGKYIALSDWHISHILTGESLYQPIFDLTHQALTLTAAAGEGIRLRQRDAVGNLTYGLVLSGIAMQLMGNSRPASGAEHHISHMIEMEPTGAKLHSTALHGEKVGVGTILASKEYHRIAALETPVWQAYETYSPEELTAVYGEKLAAELLQENAKDVAKAVSVQTLQEKWSEVQEVIAQIPTAENLIRMYTDTGAYTKLSDIGVDPSKEQVLLDYSPAVRNRLTLMRLRRCLPR